MSNWIACPICGESDMRQDAEGIVYCTNLVCGSNGGENFAAVRQEPTLEDVVPGFEQRLMAGIHQAFEWQYDECDHGTYRGGLKNGEPYAMCEIMARRIARSLQPSRSRSAP